MHPHEPDGINEALAGTLRVALTAAGQLAERAARARELEARRAHAASEQEARELQARLDAERTAARAALAPVHREEWWQHAEPGDIAAAWETAQTWKDLDPEARRARERIHDVLRERYGLDTHDLRADPAAVRGALTARDGALRGAGDERARGRDEAGDAVALLAGADRQDSSQEAERSADELADVNDYVAEAGSREGLAAALEGVADAEAVEARVVAATNQGRPAVEAVTAAPARAPRARHARGTGPVRERGRSR